MARKMLKRKIKTAVSKIKATRGRKPASAKSKVLKGLTGYATRVTAAVKESKADVMKHVKETKIALAAAKKTHAKELSKLKPLLLKSQKGNASAKMAKAMKVAQRAALSAEAKVKACVTSHDQGKGALAKLAALQKAMAQFEKTWKKESKVSMSKAKAKLKGMSGSETKMNAAVEPQKMMKTRGRKPKVVTQPAEGKPQVAEMPVLETVE